MAHVEDKDNRSRVRRYYDRTESRWGYTYLLGGTKHYGWYERGTSMWRFRRAMARMEDELASNLGLSPEGTVIDAGCGTGAVACALAERHGLRVTGIDILDWNVEAAVRRAAADGVTSQTDFRLGDFHHLDFPNSSFDGGYTMETLVHSDDPDAVLAEFFRVLKPGGRLVLFEYAHKPSDQLSVSERVALAEVCRLAEMPAWMEFEDGVLDSKLAKAGFVDVDTVDVTEKMMPMLRAFSLLGRFPYFVGRLTGQVAKTVNAMSGVEMYRHRGSWSYNISTAVKPGGSS